MKSKSDLSAISEGIRAAGQRREDERVAHNAALQKEKLLEFVPYEDTDHGIGWFHIGDEVLAYRKMSNGYELLPLFRFEAKFLKQLAKKL